MPDRAAAWLQAWDSCGIHRTGTDGDAGGAAWLAQAARTFGATVTFEEFEFDRLDPVAACLEVEGTRFDGVPVFDAPATDAAGIIGNLGPAGSSTPIGVTEQSPHAVYSPEYRALRGGLVHAALVIICQGTHPGLSLLNAEQFREPYGAPAIHLPGDARNAVLSAAARGVPARLVAHSTRTRTKATNVVATIAGRDRSKPPLVVMTPRSSWWQSTAERGGGLVCWLESLRALLARTPPRDVVFTANSGHELGHLGLDDFIARRPGWDRAGGATWLHFGANLGARGGTLTVFSSTGSLRDQAERALTEAGQPPDVLAPTTRVPSGETRDIHRAGGPYLTLVGSNPLFHHPHDRWPHAVDVAAVSRIATAAARLAVALSQL